MLANEVEFMALLTLVFFYVLKTKGPRMAAIPAIGILVEGVLAMATELYVNVALILMLTVWAILVDSAWREYRERDEF
jgi:hypothetical protein